MKRKPFEFVLTNQARHDIQLLLDYVQRIDPAGIEKWLDDLWERFETIEMFPRSGKARPDIRRGIRSLASGPTIVLYTVRTRTCKVVAVVDGRRDLTRVKLGR